MDVSMETVLCAQCHVVFAMTSDLIRKRRADHKGFFCPLGHNNYWPQKTDEEKLRDQANKLEATLEAALKEKKTLFNLVKQGQQAERERISKFIKEKFKAGAKTISLRVVAEHFNMKIRETLHVVRMAGFVCNRLSGGYHIMKQEKK